MQDLEDATLVQLARSGDKEAFGYLIERYQTMAERVAIGMVANRDLAHDLTQEAMLQAFLSLAYLQDDSRFRSWLYGIVLNVCRSYIRDRKTNHFSLEALLGGLRFEALPFSAAPDPQEIAEQRELHQLVLKAVQQLSPDNRAATLLFYYQQLSLQEIADLLGISLGAVKGRLHKSRNQLREKLLPLYLELDPSKTPKKRRKTMLKVTIAGIVRSKTPFEDIHVVVVLMDEAIQKLVPIWVGKFEGDAIAIALNNQIIIPRPLTHDFIINILAATGATLEEARIESLKDDTFFGVAKLRMGDKTQEIDCRPSDVLAVAARTKNPIYVTETVFDTAGIPIPAEYKQNLIDQVGLDNMVKEISTRFKENWAHLAFKRTIITDEERAKSRQELFTLLFGEESR